MRRASSALVLILLTLSTAPAATALAAGAVAFALNSPADQTYATTGQSIPWSLSLSVSTGDNVGLAMYAIDLTQAGSNPAKFDLPRADTPPAMLAFDAPAGLTNPGPGGVGTGYGGTPNGVAGQRNLLQIGGAQNTFGVSGGTIGQDVNVDAGVGQMPGGEVVATGTLPIPSTPGIYTFTIGNATANTLTSVAAPPSPSPTTAGTVSIAKASISFAVCIAGDVNGDLVRSAADILAFVDAQAGLATPNLYGRCAADMNGDGQINGDDIQPFVNVLLGP